MGITTITRFPKSEAEWGRNSWTRPCFKTISAIVKEQQQDDIHATKSKEEQVETVNRFHLSQPRFSTFSKKARIEELNKCLEQEVIEQSPSKKRKVVQFNPMYLERVCLFLKAQSPCELKEAHDKQLLNLPFRIICCQWPTSTTPSNDQPILVDKKSFSITSDNSRISGKLMIPNLALDKSVLVRYTLDAWTTVTDVDASFFGPYLKNTKYDTFEFTMNLDHKQLADRGEIRGELEFAVRYTIGTVDNWDNNHDKNYHIKIICDPLNNPWQSDDDIYYTEDFETHQQFRRALKDYQHAKPYHLNKQKPWPCRYDFSESLYLAKIAPAARTFSFQPNYASLMSYYHLMKEEEEAQLDNDNEQVVICTAKELPSPESSPPLSPSIVTSVTTTLDFNSNLYLYLVKNYCFHNTSDHLL